MEVSVGTKSGISWKSYLSDGNLWMDEFFSWEDLLKTSISNSQKEIDLREILKHAFALTEKEFLINESLEIETKLDFSKNWGLGSSSTLINNLSKWLEIDPYELLSKSFGGSGYDIAAASAKSAIVYHLNDLGKPKVENVDFDPTFKDKLYFVHLNQKRSSRDAIADYAKVRDFAKTKIERINELTDAFVVCDNLLDFENLIVEHEKIFSGILGAPTVKERLFGDYAGAVKSLGAWGGDFVMVTGKENPTGYFEGKGFETIVQFAGIIMQQ